jgi:hypothetical protein
MDHKRHHHKPQVVNRQRNQGTTKIKEHRVWFNHNLRNRKKRSGDGVAGAIAKDWKSTHIKDYLSIDKKKVWSLKGSLVTTKDVYLGIDLVDISWKKSKTSLQHFARRDMAARIKNIKQKWW